MLGTPGEKPGIPPDQLYKTDEAWANLEKAYAALRNDRPTKPVDILFFFGQSYGNARKEDVYGKAVDLYKDGMVKTIIIPGTEGERLNENVPRMAHPGKTLMKNRLMGMGVNAEDVVFSTPAYHTKAEGDAFLEYCLENNLRRAFSLTTPFHAVRAFLGLVETILERDLPIDVYAAMPNPNKFDWYRSVKGSQGKLLIPRSEHIEEEAKRIPTYQAKGDLASYDQMRWYMSQRGINREI